MDLIFDFLQQWQAQLHSNTAPLGEQCVAFLILNVVAALLQFIYSKWMKRSLRFFVNKTNNKWDEYVLNDNVLSVLGRFIPVAVIYYLLPYTLSETVLLYGVIHQALKASVVLLCASIVTNIIGGIDDKFTSHEGDVRPVTGVLQMLKLIVWCVAALVAIATIFDKNPLSLLTGLGASAAVLMLIFQDTIVGLVSGVQLAAYDMIRKGDWVVMEKNNVNGVVQEVNLNTVKVCNFDNSIVTVPPKVLISESFCNYSNMKDKQSRRLRAKFYLDARTVCFATDELRAKLKENGLYVENGKNPNVDDVIETNLHLCHLDAEDYMMNLPYVRNDEIILVRVEQPTQFGVPVEIYCHLSNFEWKPFEQSRARVIAHMLAVLPLFGLTVFQTPSDTSITNKN